MSQCNPHLERLRLLLPVRGRLAAGMLCMAVAVGVQLAFPQGLAYFVDHLKALQAQGLPASWLALAFAVLLLQAGASALRYYLFQSAGLAIVNGVRRRLFDALLNQPVAFFDKHHVGELSSRLSSDVQSLQESMTMDAAMALRSVCVFAGGAAMMLAISPMLGLVVACFIPATLYIGKFSGDNFRKHAREVQASVADSGKTAQEHFSHVRLVHAYNQQPGAAARYGAAIGRMMGLQLKMARLVAAFQGASALLMFSSLLLTLWLGGMLIGRGELTVGGLAAFVIYSGMVSESAGSLSTFWTSWMRSIGATERIFEILRAHRPAAAPASGLQLSGALAFRDVHFAYPERPDVLALQGMSFTVRAGEKLALVGSSGAGKSTIASLLLGYYPPTSGSIAFDGLDAAALAVADVRRHIAFVEQEPSLFSGTIAENIAFALPGRQASMEEVVAAARLANAHDFISAFPAGYDTLVGERGVQLSGGQKQRVAIARAVLRNPRILVLDEATSALDAVSEQLVQRALDKLMEGRTTLIIAHRFSTILKADRILVLDQGRLRQQGSHADLVQETDGLYFHLMRSQMAGASLPQAPASYVEGLTCVPY
jgi:ATP-binding cassette, subfamily B, bacterial